jgi:hypothetical protein
MEYEAEDEYDAVRTALGDLDTVINYPTEGSNFFQVRDNNGFVAFIEASDALDRAKQ